MKYLLSIILLIPMTLSAATMPPIEINMLQGAQTMEQIITVQQEMIMSANPKELSDSPQAVCFEATIEKFLPKSTANPKAIYGCIFSDQVSMNAALLRAGLYIHTDMGMADDDMLFSSKLMTAVGGHDFDGKELSNYKMQTQTQKTMAESKLDKFTRLKDIEREFHLKVVDPILQDDGEHFVFFSIINTSNKFKANLTHELLHAQYYNIPQLSQLLLDVWQNQVSAEDKETIITSLTNGGYDMQQQELLLREFYSYFLQYDATNYLDTIEVLKPMSPLAKVYAPKIKKALNEHDIKVLTLQNT